MKIKEYEKAKETPSKKIRKGDKVVVITGNDRGQTGVVQELRGDRVVVQGINVRKKCIKPSQAMPKGRIIDLECPIHVSNVKICVDGDKGVKLKVRTNEDGQRQFVYNNDGQEVVYRSVKKPK